jgi:hypothetical protein
LYVFDFLLLVNLVSANEQLHFENLLRQANLHVRGSSPSVLSNSNWRSI